MLCQWILDACCFATIFEWIFLDDPLIDLALTDLGACQCLLRYCQKKGSKNFIFSLFYCIILVFTCMHRCKKGLISFFKLSRIIPNNFSMHAAKCCLKSNAGYLASTLDWLFVFPTIPLYPLEIPIPIEDDRRPWKLLYLVEWFTRNLFISPNFQVGSIHMPYDQIRLKGKYGCDVKPQYLYWLPWVNFEEDRKG